MPIVTADIKKFLSGGAANADLSLSLGGAISSVEIADATLHNMFDIVSSAEALAGDIEYRCIYFKNTHATLTLTSAVVWIQTQTPSSDTSIGIALAGEGVSVAAESVADESTAPVGESFTAPANEGTALAIGDLAPGAYIGVWIRRTVNASAAAYNSDSVVLRIKGDTAA